MWRHGKKLAVLASALASHHDELYADFQQYYGIDLWTLAIFDERHTTDVDRAAILAAQLPRDARVHVAVSPLARVSQTDELLRRVEYNQRVWHWANSKDGEHGANQPKPLMFDGEQEAHDRAAEREARHSKYVADLLGLHGLEAIA